MGRSPQVEWGRATTDTSSTSGWAASSIWNAVIVCMINSESGRTLLNTDAARLLAATVNQVLAPVLDRNATICMLDRKIA